MTERFPYEDIVNLPPHISRNHPQPTMMERAARFAPFAAITGYEEMVLEEARVTVDRVNLDEGALAILNEKLNIIHEFLSEEPEVTITYFELDKKKSGGAYARFGLTEPSLILFEQLLTIDRRRLRGYVGSIDDYVMAQAEKALRISLGLEEVYE